MDQLPRFGKRELICLLLFTCNVVSVRRGFIFLLVLGMGCIILLLRSLRLPYNYLSHSIPQFPNFVLKNEQHTFSSKWYMAICYEEDGLVALCMVIPPAFMMRGI